MFYGIKESLKSVKFFAGTIWNHRWWDYGFFQTLLDKQLEYMEKHFGTDSIFIGDCFTKGRIIILRKYLKEWVECDDFDLNGKDCKKKRKKFFKHLERNIEKFWD
jgi:hypothetical protein